MGDPMIPNVPGMEALISAAEALRLAAFEATGREPGCVVLDSPAPSWAEVRFHAGQLQHMLWWGTFAGVDVWSFMPAEERWMHDYDPVPPFDDDFGLR
jgi:hypothetical protein